MSSRSKRLSGVFRAVGYGAVVAGILGGVGVFAARRAAARDLGEQAMSLGRDLQPIRDLIGSDVKRMRINGEHLWISHRVVPMSTEDVIKRFDDECQANGAMSPEAWSKALEKKGVALAEEAMKPNFALPVLAMKNQRGEGVVLCIVRGENSKGDFTSRVAEYKRNRDLGVLGKLRYAYVKPEIDGAAEKQTSVFTVFSEDSLKLNNLHPASFDSDVAGDDDPGLPRPTDSIRILSAAVEGAPYGMHSYRTKTDPKATMTSYDAQLVARGFSGVSPPQAAGADPIRAYVKDGIAIVVGSKSIDGHTSLTISELGSDAVKHGGSAFAGSGFSQ